jgi:hypothetical protein
LEADTASTSTGRKTMLRKTMFATLALGSVIEFAAPAFA